MVGEHSPDQPQRSTQYLYKEDSYEPLARVDRHGDSSEIYWYHSELNGLPERMTDAQGKVVWHGRFSAWGATDAESGTLATAQNLRYQGQYLDRETGLHYNLFRYYDPNCGRFTQSDPIGLAGGVNTYRYAPNTLTWVDPLGLSPCKPTTQLPAAELGQYNYRGLHKGHPAWDDALQGKVIPGNVNSKLSAEEHNLGGFSANSPYTSWTDDPNIARRFAGEDGIILRVKTGAPQPGASWSWDISIDEYFEREILLKGIRTGDVEVFLP